MKKTAFFVLAVVGIALVSIPAVGEEVYLSETGRTLMLEKDLYSETYIAIDEEGKRIDALPLMQAEVAAKEAKYGKLGKNLFGRMTAAGKDDEILVRVFLYKTPELAEAVNDEAYIRSQKNEMTAAGYESALKAAQEYRLGIAESMIATAGQAVEKLGGSVQSASAPTHSFAALMSKSAIMKLQKRSDVFKIYYDNLKAEPAQDVAWRSMGAAANWPYAIHGGGERVAVVEGDSIITANRPYINVLGVRDNSCPGDHATQVAHCIGASQNHWTGIAYQGSVVSANDCSWSYTGLANAVDWAYANYHPDVYNHSYGGDTNGAYTSLDQFLDQHSADNFTFHVVAAGNSNSQCQTGQMYVSSPGLAYNVLTVGATDDHNVVPIKNHTMASFSCYENPSLHGWPEKPEVVAPGVNIQWKVAGPPKGPPPNIFQSNSGTSFSAPLTAGVATLIEDAQSSCYWSVMSGHKAAILATAAFDIDTTGGRSKDGVGAVFAGTLPEVFNNAFCNCFAGTISSDHDVYVDLQDGVTFGDKKIRVALVWEEDPSGPHRSGLPYPDYPQNDWDLMIYDPDGNLVVGSYWTWNTWDIVEFTVNQPGTWRFHINNFTNSGISSKMAMVWAAIP